MLWVSADPGCVKSGLVKYLVDSIFPTTKSRTVCYFCFKDDFKDHRNVISALRRILYQLFTQKRILLSDAILDQSDTEEETFTRSFGVLWQTLINAAEDEKAGEIVCLLDALDECEGHGRSQLAKKLCQLYGTSSNFNLKFLLTIRPYSIIRQDFQPLKIVGMPEIHLSGESDIKIEKISREIDIFIKASVGTIRFWCWDHHIPMTTTPCLVIPFILSLPLFTPFLHPLSSPPSFAPFVAMTHRAARYESTALRALLPCNASFMYINSSIVLSL